MSEHYYGKEACAKCGWSHGEKAELDAVTERMAPSPCGVAGHVMLNWVSAGYTIPYSYRGQEITDGYCRSCAEIAAAVTKELDTVKTALRIMLEGKQGAAMGAVCEDYPWLNEALAQTSESAYQRGVSDGIESVARGRTNNE